MLNASELVTKCPSKYENATNALTVSQLTGYGDEVVDKPVKVAGAVKDGTLKAAGEGDRFVLVDPENGEELAVEFNDAISEEVKDGSSLVLTGSMERAGQVLRNRSGPRRLDRFLQTKGGRIAAPKG